MTYRERKNIEEFVANVTKEINDATPRPLRAAIDHINNLCRYVDELEREAKK